MRARRRLAVLVDDPRPIDCPVCGQKTAVKNERIVPHLSGMVRGYCTGTSIKVKPYEPGEFDPQGKWKDDDEADTQDP
jgi:hypothetical protein